MLRAPDFLSPRSQNGETCRLYNYVVTRTKDSPLPSSSWRDGTRGAFSPAGVPLPSRLVVCGNCNRAYITPPYTHQMSRLCKHILLQIIQGVSVYVGGEERVPIMRKLR